MFSVEYLSRPRYLRLWPVPEFQARSVCKSYGASDSLKAQPPLVWLLQPPAFSFVVSLGTFELQDWIYFENYWGNTDARPGDKKRNSAFFQQKKNKTPQRFEECQFRENWELRLLVCTETFLALILHRYILQAWL